MICACGIGNIPDTAEGAQAHALLCTLALRAKLEAAERKAEQAKRFLYAEHIDHMEQIQRAQAAKSSLAEALAVLREVVAAMDSSSEGACPACHNTSHAKGHCSEEPCVWELAYERARALSASPKEGTP